MPVFEYTARNLKGDLVKDKIDLATREDVIAQLRTNPRGVVRVRRSRGGVPWGAGPRVPRGRVGWAPLVPSAKVP